MPEGVVRKIVKGGEKERRPHVSMRTVTIMFTDIRDFTAISETLSQTDLLFVLTRYLTAMTGVAEHYRGEVTEILGDGLLIFWNTPEDVPDHAAKACAAALAMQEALASLNGELQSRDFPRLSIRCGLHTGSVLSGNIGCSKKMKFGCLGDPVNLASRLEGLCKHYGVDVICSGATYDALEQDAGFNFVTRKLALVQVKGKREPTWVYEVMARIGGVGRARTPRTTCPSTVSQDLCVDSGGGDFRLRPRNGISVAATASWFPGGYDETDDFVIQCIEHKRVYESALAAYQGARFCEARTLAVAVLQEWPEDTAAKLLLERLDSMGGETMALAEADMAAWTGAVVITEK